MALTRWWENQRRFAFGDWRVMKVRKRSKVKERLPVMVGLSQAEAIKQAARLTGRKRDSHTSETYEIEQWEV